MKPKDKNSEKKLNCLIIKIIKLKVMRFGLMLKNNYMMKKCSNISNKNNNLNPQLEMQK